MFVAKTLTSLSKSFTSAENVRVFPAFSTRGVLFANQPILKIASLLDGLFLR